MSQPVCKLPHFSSNLHNLDHKWATLYPRLSCIFLHGNEGSPTPFVFAAVLVSLGCCLYPAFLSPALFVCLTSFLFLHLFSLFSFLFFSLLLICCVWCVPKCAQYFVHKDGFSSHLSPSAKSSHPSGTYCSYELCQPSPVCFMNNFLLNFFFKKYTHVQCLPW